MNDTGTLRKEAHDDLIAVLDRTKEKYPADYQRMVNTLIVACDANNIGGYTSGVVMGLPCCVLGTLAVGLTGDSIADDPAVQDRRFQAFAALRGQRNWLPIEEYILNATPNMPKYKPEYPRLGLIARWTEEWLYDDAHPEERGGYSQWT